MAYSGQRFPCGKGEVGEQGRQRQIRRTWDGLGKQGGEGGDPRKEVTGLSPPTGFLDPMSPAGSVLIATPVIGAKVPTLQGWSL